ncbi:MAG: DUF4360 domain-containing protein [Desulfobacteraceae bacterium]|nr:DUF4360 domain-containing protein [Desulfobacteraceae bacterium]
MAKTAVIIVFFAVAGFIFNINAYAVDVVLSENSDIYIYDFVYWGDGCLSGTGSAFMSSDYKKISVFFDEYYASSAENFMGRDRKSCNLEVAVHVPQGMAVALVQKDYRGYVDVPPGGYAAFLADTYFAGQITGYSFRKEWGNETDRIEEDYTLKDEFYPGCIVYSICGEDVIISENTTLKVYANSETGADTYAEGFTLFDAPSIAYQLIWEKCE